MLSRPPSVPNSFPASGVPARRHDDARCTASGRLAGREALRETQFDMVAVRARGSPADEERFLELGLDDCLSKPLRQTELHAMLSKRLMPQAPSEADGEEPQAVLDAGALARLGELDPRGDNRLLERVLKAFQTSAARLAPQLEAARLSNDRAAIRLVAHTLKSSSASIGALKLSRICAQIETAVRTESSIDLNPDIDAMTAALAITLTAISQRLGSL